jgi:hypothetical protein
MLVSQIAHQNGDHRFILVDNPTAEFSYLKTEKQHLAAQL